MTISFHDRLLSFRARLFIAAVLISDLKLFHALYAFSLFSSAAIWAHAAGHQIVEFDAICDGCKLRRWFHISGRGCLRCAWYRSLRRAWDSQNEKTA